MENSARDVVSKVRGMLKMHSPDLFISDRLILSVILPINNKILSQQISQRRAWGVESLYVTIPCLEMEQVPLYSCCDTQSECNIARSISELPDIVDSYHQLVIQRVSDISGKNKFSEMSTPERYNNILKLYPNTTDKYFFMKGRHLYVTDPEIEKVSITFLPKGLVDPEEYSCGKNSIECSKNPLDLEFKTLPKIEGDVVRLSMQEILQTYAQIKPQINSGDDIEGN